MSLKSMIIRPLKYIWGIIPQKIKYGKTYRDYVRLLDKSQLWSAKKHDAYQFRKLKEILCYAKENVPYYRDMMAKAGFEPSAIQSFKDISALPFSDKDTYINNSTRMISQAYDLSRLEEKTTGGTTGRQIRFYVLKNWYEKREVPFVNAIWARAGYIPGKSRMARLRNDVLPEGCLWQFNYSTRNLVFDTYHLTDDNIGKILSKLADWRAEFLHTYPSSALILADYIKRKKINYFSSLKAIFVTSENIYPGQREIIEKYLHAECFTFYGHSECAALAGWCEYSDKYHIQSEYGYLELIDEKGDVITEPGIRGEIVCTGFDCYAVPFIRYRTGDYASYAKEQTCRCGRHYKLLEGIEGRWTQEMFYGKKKNKISMTALNMHSDIFKNVRNYQFVQNEPGKCVLRIVCNNAYSIKDESMIRDELMKKFDYTIDLTFEYVDEILKTERGKQRFIVQNVEL